MRGGGWSGRCWLQRVAGEGVLELYDALLQADDLLPETISLGSERDNAFRHLGDVVMPTNGLAGDQPVEILSLLSREGQRIHVRAAPKRKTRNT